MTTPPEPVSRPPPRSARWPQPSTRSPRPRPSSEAGGLDGRTLSPLWAVPFAGILLSIALGPVLAPRLWHHHYGKVALAWGAATALALLAHAGPGTALDTLLDTLLLEYLPFVLLLLALFTVTGGLRVEGPFGGTPASNTALLAAGTALASLAGTTGAAMLMIRPLIRANAWRRRRSHAVVFFIFLVANVGGALTPLGDPPLFLGYLRGVPFFWPTVHLLLPTLLCSAVLLLAFFLVDSCYLRGESRPEGVMLARLRLEGREPAAPRRHPVRRPGERHVERRHRLHLPRPLPDLGGAAARLGAARRRPHLLARHPRKDPRGQRVRLGTDRRGGEALRRHLRHHRPGDRDAAGRARGPFAPVVALVTHPDGSPADPMFFWATGLLSSFLDNAPTYLVFFNLAGGDPAQLTADLPRTLAAVSAGAVFMGANTYIGNAPNFMVRAIAEEMGLRMPSFFGYMLWSSTVLLPLFALVTWLFFG